MVDALVDGERPYVGPGCFDEPRVRAVAERVVDRSRDLAAGPTTSRWRTARLRLARLAGLPTPVLHGTADPLVPLAHGRAPAAAIPGARLVELGGVGHQLPPPHTWDLVVDALVAHTA